MDQQTTQQATEIHLPGQTPKMSPSPSSKTNVLLITLGVILLLAVTAASAYFFIFKPKERSKQSNPITQIQSAPSPNAISEPLSDWKTIESEYCGVAIQYPPDWVGEVKENKGCIFSVSSHDAKRAFLQMSSIHYDPNWREKQRIDQLKLSNTTVAISDIRIAGVDGVNILVKYNAVKNIDTPDIRQIFFNKGNVQLWAVTSGEFADAKTKALHEEMIRSITFTKEDDYYTSVQIDSNFPLKIANNQLRLGHTHMLYNAIQQYRAKNNTLPSGITSQPRKISNNEAHLCTQLVPTYLPSLPIDPSAYTPVIDNPDKPMQVTDCTSSYQTNYTVMQNGDGTVSVSAPLADLEEIITAPIE